MEHTCTVDTVLHFQTLTILITVTTVPDTKGNSVHIDEIWFDKEALRVTSLACVNRALVDDLVADEEEQLAGGALPIAVVAAGVLGDDDDPINDLLVQLIVRKKVDETW